MHVVRQARIWALVSSVALALAACSVIPSPIVPSPVMPGSTRDDGVFHITCAYSHSLRDDPIVFPGIHGASHTHDFYGATTTDASSTATTLQASPTTCSKASDHSGYWQPALYANGTAQIPKDVLVYYKGTSGTVAFPTGLRMIAGDAHAKIEQSPSVTTWRCRPNGVTKVTTFPACAMGQSISTRVEFPNCWDGVNLDSADHKSHMAYGSLSRCPADHPVAVPRLTVHVRWHKIAPDPATASLASGSTVTMHADFFNAWDQTTLASLVSQCLNANVQCGGISGP
jgi:hypothetical protein